MQKPGWRNWIAEGRSEAQYPHPGDQNRHSQTKSQNETIKTTHSETLLPKQIDLKNNSEAEFLKAGRPEGTLGRKTPNTSGCQGKVRKHTFQAQTIARNMGKPFFSRTVGRKLAWKRNSQTDSTGRDVRKPSKNMQNRIILSETHIRVPID